MAEQGVRNPGRMTRALAPGFPEPPPPADSAARS